MSQWTTPLQPPPPPPASSLCRRGEDLPSPWWPLLGCEDASLWPALPLPDGQDACLSHGASGNTSLCSPPDEQLVEDIWNLGAPAPLALGVVDAPDMTLLELFGPLPDQALDARASGEAVFAEAHGHDEHGHVLTSSGPCHQLSSRGSTTTATMTTTLDSFVAGTDTISSSAQSQHLVSHPRQAQTGYVSPASSASKRKRSDSVTSHEDEQTVMKRQRNTMAARRYRQKRLDRLADLERALGKMTEERDELRMQLARREVEVEGLREMLARK